MFDVVVPLYNDADTSARCLTHLRAFMPRGAHLTLVDNGSSDWTPQLCAQFRSRYVTVIRNENNCGVYAAMNQGIRLAEHRVVVLMNSDVLVGPMTFPALADALRDCEALCVGAREVKPPARLGALFEEPVSNSVLRPGAVGAFQAHRRELYEEVGLFDEQFFLTFGDADLTERLHRTGSERSQPERYRSVVATTVVVYHLGASSRRSNWSADADTAMELEDQRRFRAKWADTSEVLARHPEMTAEMLLNAKRAEWGQSR